MARAVTMRFTELARLAIGAACLVLAGCASSGQEAECCRPAQEGAKHAVAVNGRCPIQPDEDASQSTALVDYHGKKVAFCCPGCIKSWDKMTDAQKDQALEKVASSAR